MIEIRPIRAEEADEFLKVMCDAFDLNFTRARAVFFSEPLFDLNRKWALIHGGELVSILTVTPLLFGFGRAIGIAGVATRQDSRRQGYASRLLRHVLSASEGASEGSALLFAAKSELYVRGGFEHLERVVRAPLAVMSEPDHDDMLDVEQVRSAYERWAEKDRRRLRRDSRRWRYWQWNYKIALPGEGGYVVHEPGVLREAVVRMSPRSLPVTVPCEWFGLPSLADELGLCLGPAVWELDLLGYRVPRRPSMFMTDQF